MKAIFKRELLLAAHQIVSLAVPSKSNKPILCSLKITIGDGIATLYGTDGEIGIQSIVRDVESDGEWIILLDDDKFGKIVKSVKDELISISGNENRILIKAGKSKFDISNFDPLGFPSFPEIDLVKYHSVPSAAFKMIISRVSFCSDSGGRYATDGVLLECNEGEMIAVATDTKQVAKIGCSAQSFGGHLNNRTIIPKKAAPVIVKAAQGEYTFVTCTDNTIFLRSDMTMAFARLMDGTFPPWRKVIDRPMPSGVITIELKTEDLIAAVNQASIVGLEDSGIFFTVENNSMTIKGSGESGSSEAEVQVNYDGPQGIVCINKKSIQNCLRSISSCPLLTMQLFDRETVLGISTNDGYKYIAMPMVDKKG